MQFAGRLLAQKFRWTSDVTFKSCVLSSSANSAVVSQNNLIRSNSNRASITRPTRLQYLRNYPVVVVNSDGSTYNIRHHEPRKIIKLPVDISLLSEAERKVHLERRKPKTRVSLEEDAEEVSFDATKYLKLVK